MDLCQLAAWSLERATVEVDDVANTDEALKLLWQKLAADRQAGRRPVGRRGARPTSIAPRAAVPHGCVGITQTLREAHLRACVPLPPQGGG